MDQSNRREIFSQSESKEFCQPIIFLHQVKEQHLSICKCSMGKSGQHNCVRHLLQCYVPYLLIFVVKSCSSISFSRFFRICERLGCGPIQFGCQKLKKEKKIKLGLLGWPNWIGTFNWIQTKLIISNIFPCILIILDHRFSLMYRVDPKKLFNQFLSFHFMKNMKPVL